MSNGDNDKWSLAAIPEGFYDIIGRVAAGCAAIVLYRWYDMPKITGGTESTTVLVLGLLILSWTIGLILEGVGYSLYLIRKIGWIEKNIADKILPKEHDEGQAKPDKDERRRRIKFVAELLFFRSMIVLSAVSFIASPPVFLEWAGAWHWDWARQCSQDLLELIGAPRILSIGCGVVASWCWYARYIAYWNPVENYSPDPGVTAPKQNPP